MAGCGNGSRTKVMIDQIMILIKIYAISNHKTLKQLIMKRIILSVLLIAMSCHFIHGQDSTLQQYVGKYWVPDAEMQVTIKLDNGSLTIAFPAGTSGLTRMGIDTFETGDLRGRTSSVVFRRNETKKVSGISISINDIILEGKKED